MRRWDRADRIGERLRDRPLGRSAALIVVIGAMIWAAQPAAAACHQADFTEHEVTVDEDAERVDLTVFLIGRQPSCEGSVRYRTVDGTASAGQDYTATSGELTFRAGDSREGTITVPIIDNNRVDGSRTFTVRLIPVSGSDIQPVGRDATVTIADDEPAGPPPEASPTLEPSPTQTVPSPRDTDETVGAAPVGEEDGGSAGPLIAIAAVLVALAAAGAWFWRRRATA